jgi:hypothetical protein
MQASGITIRIDSLKTSHQGIRPVQARELKVLLNETLNTILNSSLCVNDQSDFSVTLKNIYEDDYSVDWRYDFFILSSTRYFFVIEFKSPHVEHAIQLVLCFIHPNQHWVFSFGVKIHGLKHQMTYDLKDLITPNIMRQSRVEFMKVLQNLQANRLVTDHVSDVLEALGDGDEDILIPPIEDHILFDPEFDDGPLYLCNTLHASDSESDYDGACGMDLDFSPPSSPRSLSVF